MGGGWLTVATIKVATIGKGAFGKVMLVRMRGSNQLFAMKKLRKDEMMKKDQVRHVHSERAVFQLILLLTKNLMLSTKKELTHPL